MAVVVLLMQGVHYPAFRFVPAEVFDHFHRAHVRGIGPIVLGGMAVEGFGAAWRLVVLPGWPSALGLALCATAMLWTGLVSGPIHNRLSTDPDPEQIERLIRTNLARVFFWSAHAGLSLAMALGFRG